MAENPVIPSDLCDSDSETNQPLLDLKRCEQLSYPPHISAFLSNTDLNRDTEPILCDQSLLENITTNYVIVKKIISFLPWQDKLLCKNVCSMWRSAVNTLQKEQLSPSDFVMNLRISHIRNGVKLFQAENFNTEPLVVFAFVNTVCSNVSCKCEALIPSPCDPACEKEHFVLDVVKHHVTDPKKCMLGIKATYLSYMPLPQSITYKHTITVDKLKKAYAFIGGVYIPVIPNVEFKVINMKNLAALKNDFFKIVEDLAETHYVKGVLAFVNESFLLDSVEDIIFLNFFNQVQPDVPYALGGCIVEDTISDKEDMDIMIEATNSGLDLHSENLVSIGLFTIRKELYNTQTENGCHFDVFSLIIESSEWSKAKIQSAINEFSGKVPHFEHSVALKLSCVGRDQKHDYEQDYFRLAFPNTRIVGCYGNGELGVNRPPRPKPEVPLNNTVKRHRRDPGPQYGIMYSYSTVFVYIGWGRIITAPETN